MTAALPRDKTLARMVQSNARDACHTGTLVIELDHTAPLPMIRLRLEGHRRGVKLDVDGLYSMLVKLSAGG